MISTLRRTNSAATQGPDQLSLPISGLDSNVLSFYVAKLAQREPNGLRTGRLRGRRRATIDTLSEGLSSAAARRLMKQLPKEYLSVASSGFFFSLVSLRLFHSHVTPNFSPTTLGDLTAAIPSTKVNNNRP